MAIQETMTQESTSYLTHIEHCRNNCLYRIAWPELFLGSSSGFHVYD